MDNNISNKLVNLLLKFIESSTSIDDIIYERTGIGCYSDEKDEHGNRFHVVIKESIKDIKRLDIVTYVIEFKELSGEISKESRDIILRKMKEKNSFFIEKETEKRKKQQEIIVDRLLGL